MIYSREFIRNDAVLVWGRYYKVSEKQELKKLRELDPETITEIHNRYFPEIYRYCRYRLGDQDTAEDVAGEVFVRLLESLHEGRGPSKSLRGWFFGTASNLINDTYRRRYRLKMEQIPEDLVMNNAGPYEFVELQEELDEVMLASMKLTPDQQHVLALRFGSALSVEETGKIMGKRPNAIKALQFRALNALRRHLGVEHP